MSQPGDHLFGAVCLAPQRQGRTVDHKYGQAQLPCCREFGAGAGTAGVLGHHQVDPVLTHQRKIALDRKGTPVEDDLTVGKGQFGIGRVHESQQVKMLWVRSKFGQMHTPDGKHDPAGRDLKGCDCGRDIRNMLPAVTIAGRPGRAGQRNQRHLRCSTGCDGIAAHLCGKGVCGIDDMGNSVVVQVLPEAFSTAETAAAQGQGLAHRTGHTSGKRYRAGDVRLAQRAGQRCRPGGPAENEQVGCHV